MENFLANTFSITIQPKQNFHFRYVSELKNTHGVITGQLQQQAYNAAQSPNSSNSNNNNSIIEETYPSIRFQLPADGHLDEYGNKRDFFVLCSLHSYNDDSGPQSLSPHLLMPKRAQKPSFDFIFSPMEENLTNPLERSWQLKDYVIVRLKPDDFRQALAGKQQHFKTLQLPAQVFERLKGDVDLEDPKSVKASGTLNVCLGFTIFERDFYSNVYRLYKEIIYSDNIFHGDDLRIHELCNTKGPIGGGTKVHILIKLPSGYKYFVRMFKQFSHDSETVEWEEFVPINPADIFSNAAITYALPPGPPNGLTDEIEVMIEIVVNQSSYKSKPVKFWYLNTNDNESGRRKRQRTSEAAVSSFSQHLEDSNESQQSVSLSMNAIDPHLMHYNSDGLGSYVDVGPLQVLSSSLETNNDAMISLSINNQQQQQEQQQEHQQPQEDLHDLSFFNDDNFLLQSVNQLLLEVPDADALLHEIIEALPLSNQSYPQTGQSSTTQPYYSQDRCESVEVRKEKIIKKTLMQKIDVSDLIKKKIDRISNANQETDNASEINVKGLSNTSGNTIFHDALRDMGLLVYLYRQQKKSPHLKQLILKARNAYRQNLLHYACTLNKESCIRPLIGMGVALHEQDAQGRTPLHIAIDYSMENCLHKFQNLLQDHSKYPPEVEKQLIQMFQVYSHKGFTVLQSAAIESRYDLVEIMLKFCTTHRVDILRYEALGSGDSIVHLIVRRNLLNMIGLIRKYVPKYLTVENYSGETVMALPDLSEEMKQALICEYLYSREDVKSFAG